MGYNGVGRQVVVDGTMDSITYTRILFTHLYTSAELLGLNDDFIFQQNNLHAISPIFMWFVEKNNIKRWALTRLWASWRRFGF